jgi:hypothetical protein
MSYLSKRSSHSESENWMFSWRKLPMNFDNKHNRAVAAMTAHFVLEHFSFKIVGKIEGKLTILI